MGVHGVSLKRALIVRVLYRTDHAFMALTYYLNAKNSLVKKKESKSLGRYNKQQQGKEQEQKIRFRAQASRG